MIQPQELHTFFTELTVALDSDRLYPRDLDVFFDGLAYRLEVFQSAKKQINRYIASDFNVFSYIWADEQRLSDILRDLLNPDGPHGQGDTFLRKFLHLIGCETAYHPGDTVTVSREVPTHRIQRTQRGLDLLIDIRRHGQSVEGIAIENKPWALDQEAQIADYLHHLARSYANGHYRIVYLTKNGTPPSPHSTENAEELQQQDKLLLMAYASVPTMRVYNLLEWLDTCHHACQSEKVRWFVRDLIQYIQQNLQHEPSE
jgi:hypothetical protein